MRYKHSPTRGTICGSKYKDCLIRVPGVGPDMVGGHESNLKKLLRNAEGRPGTPAKTYNS